LANQYPKARLEGDPYLWTNGVLPANVVNEVFMTAAELPSAKVQHKQATQEAKVRKKAPQCRHCDAALDDGARYCSECGESTGSPCVHCGAEVGGGDFCEACGTWLRESQCRFCYAELPDNTAFCTECGNDRHGLWCARCKTQSFFDFCGGCGDALSETARQMVQQAPSDPALAAALAALHTLNEQAGAQQEVSGALATAPPKSEPATVSPKGLSLTGALQALREMSQREAVTAEMARQAAEAARRQAEAERMAQRARQAAEQVAREREARELEERQQEMARSEASAFSLSAQRRAARERVKALLDANENLTFPDPQTARRHFMSVRQKMAREGFVPLKWLCNFANCQHDTPNECADPSQGGRWLFE
jgi:hypothetical protein